MELDDAVNQDGATIREREAVFISLAAPAIVRAG